MWVVSYFLAKNCINNKQCWSIAHSKPNPLQIYVVPLTAPRKLAFFSNVTNNFISILIRAKALVRIPNFTFSPLPSLKISLLWRLFIRTNWTNSDVKKTSSTQYTTRPRHECNISNMFTMCWVPELDWIVPLPHNNVNSGPMVWSYLGAMVVCSSLCAHRICAVYEVILKGFHRWFGDSWCGCLSVVC